MRAELSKPTQRSLHGSLSQQTALEHYSQCVVRYSQSDVKTIPNQRPKVSNSHMPQKKKQEDLQGEQL